ncbi:MAG: hypothetical protein JSW38_13230 [Dehalococcoidia bacterium]|nr:MAG: hypothetical protein JSW38_13230 [Dehalococcoidia bacterium]
MGFPVSPLRRQEHVIDFTHFPVVTAKPPLIRPGHMELGDYSGQLQRQLSPMDFTKDVLVEMTKVLGTIYMLHDGLWLGRVAERWGDKVAWDREIRMWEIHTKYNGLYHAEALNVQGTPVEKCLKVQQINLGMGSLLYDLEVELMTPNVGIITNLHCKTVDFFLSHGEELAMYNVCWSIEQPGFEGIAKCLDPGMRCMPIKLIPRMNDNEPYCKWVYWLGDIKAGDPKGYVAAMNKAAEAEGVPQDLKDYSGPLHKRLGVENFCKETVAKLLVQCSRLYRILDGQWRSVIQELYGDEAAWELQEKVWGVSLGANSKRVSKALNIQGSPVERCLKLLQVNPGFGLLYNCTFELESPDVGIVSNYRCTTREFFEKMGGEVNLSRICGDMEQKLLQRFANTVDPGLKVKPVKSPSVQQRALSGKQIDLADPVPLNSEYEPVCQWEIRL